MAQSMRWCFTLNNPTDLEIAGLRAHADQVTYLVFGHETAPTTGTPHLQGFVVFTSNKRRGALVNFSARAWYEVARGTSLQASDYCKKGGEFEEFGQVPGPVGKTNVYDGFRDWVLAQPTKPTEYDVGMLFPGLAVRNRESILRFIDVIYPRPPRVLGDFRPYQQRLADLLEVPPCDRKIIFVIDGVGNTGKSWFIRKFLTLNDTAQHLSVGRIEDVNYAINPRKSVFLFDVPRTRLQFLQYSVLEGLKDGCVMSTKYMSQMKELDGPCHVVVFTNEEPDMNALSRDRYVIIRWVSVVPY